MTLIERLESASDGSRELDVAIAEEALGLIVEQVDCVNNTSPIREYSVKALHCNVWRNLPYYTTSLDAALTLVPEGRGLLMATGTRARADVIRIGHLLGHTAKAATLPLALTIACLKAREEMK